MDSGINTQFFKKHCIYIYLTNVKKIWYVQMKILETNRWSFFFISWMIISFTSFENIYLHIVSHM